ncbi:MAG: DUF1015 domain-containing protein [Clostridia bacterium]|nr:DUF1015 domain-containing protein [Clostridia bacterium]
MANIKAFNGYRYNHEKIENLGSVMAPLYDTISDDERDMYFNSNEHNITRISKGISKETDNEDDNIYTRARDYLKKWIEDDILIRDKKPSLYLYEQRVNYNDTMFVNHGIVSLLELSELQDNEVLTCELPTVTTIQDRYNLLSATNANVDMISCMYIDPEKNLSSLLTKISDREPDMEFTTQEKVIEAMTTHKIWTITDTKTISFITQSLKNKTFFITDGHNRYATALEYKKYCKENDKNYNENSGCNYIMSWSTNAYGNRMVQLPVHRLLTNEKKFNEDFFIACAQDNFKIEKIIVDTSFDDITETMKKLIHTSRMETKFGVYCGGNYFYRLTLTDKGIMKKLLPDKSSAYGNLDVTVFNELILGDILNIKKEDYDKYIKYTKRASKGTAAVNNNEVSCLFILNPVKAEQIREVALSGDVMPDRSIYIFPKPETGVIINKF